MPDYGHDLLFGCFIAPVAEQSETVITLARLADASGLDLVTVQDHPYQPAFLDTWTLLSHLAARTQRVRLAPNVTNLPLRPPAMLARAAASLDVITGGRVELGLGAGAFWEGIASMGGPRLDARGAVDALEQGIGVVRRIWDPAARSRPRPAHDIEIWLGAYRPRMLRITGRLADGWLPSSGYAAPEVLAGMTRVIDEATLEAGRSPSDVRRL
ncbi:MAG TPA: LLM class flavin-dependent oxidoreductase, partial [Actinomycetes bacterium]